MMRLLLDENLDWRLRRDLLGHQVESVPLIGWAGIENGELLRKAVEAQLPASLEADPFAQRLLISERRSSKREHLTPPQP